MRLKTSYLKGILIIIICIVLYFAVYPLYVKWNFGNYTRKFADILNSHDMEEYDDFFSEDTIFELNGEQIKYADAKENMAKVQAFRSTGSYGYLDEWFDFKEFMMESMRKEHRGCLMLPIYDCPDRGNMFIEGEMILKRKWLFFFDIEKVICDEEEGREEERFLSDFWGI